MRRPLLLGIFLTACFGNALDAQRSPRELVRQVPLRAFASDSEAAGYVEVQAERARREGWRYARENLCRPTVAVSQFERVSGDHRVVRGRLVPAGQRQFSPSEFQYATVQLRGLGVRSQPTSDGTFAIAYRGVLPEGGRWDTLEVSSPGRRAERAAVRITTDSVSVVEAGLCYGLASGSTIIDDSDIMVVGHERRLTDFDPAIRPLRTGGGAHLVGDQLHVLRRGLLARVDLASGSPRSTQLRTRIASDRYPEEWEDELVGYGRVLATLDHGRGRPFAVLRTFVVGPGGTLIPRDTAILDGVPPTRQENLAAHLLGSRLRIYTVSRLVDEEESALPPMIAMWASTDEGEPFLDSVPAWITERRVYVPERESDSVSVTTVHTLLDCDLATPSLTCRTTTVVGPRTHDYTFADSALVISTDVDSLPSALQESRAPANGTLFIRIPYAGEAPSAFLAAGYPADRHAVRDRGDAVASLQLSTHRPHLDRFARWPDVDTTSSASLLTVGRETSSLRLSVVGDSVALTQYVGSHLVAVSNGDGYGSQADSANPGAALQVVHLESARQSQFRTDYWVHRVVDLGGRALLIGQGRRSVLASVLVLDSAPRIVSTAVFPRLADIDLHSVLTVDRAPAGQPGWFRIGFTLRDLTVDSMSNAAEANNAAWFLDLRGDSLVQLGSLVAAPATFSEEADLFPMINRMGLSQSVIQDDRVYAIFDGELVAGRVEGGGVTEIWRRPLFSRDQDPEDRSTRDNAKTARH